MTPMTLLRAYAYAACCALSLVPAVAATTELPAIWNSALRVAQVPAGAVSVVIEPLGGDGLRVASRDEMPRNPASTMKLVTTYAALDLLGPAYAWKTEAFLVGEQRGDMVFGDLAVRGSGDPKLVIEQLWLLVQRIRAAGIREIRGDLVLDKSAFIDLEHDPAEFDGAELRSYNVGPDALLVNFKSIAFNFRPDPARGTVSVSTVPVIDGMRLPRTLPAGPGACGNFHSKLRADFSKPLEPVFRGTYPLACGERSWNLSLLDHTTYFGEVFRALWREAGGAFAGEVRTGAVPPGARLIAAHESPPLSLVIRDINKYSNNVMAQQLYLAIGAHVSGEPGSTLRSGEAVRNWLAVNRIEMPALVLENGAGLSRVERVSARGLANLLVHAWNSPRMPELVASLPLVGVDGTARNRDGAAGYAHIKTGLLNDVRSIAGYVLAASGERYVVVAIANHPNAGGMHHAFDALLDWVRAEG